jgi:hypothetical protein
LDVKRLAAAQGDELDTYVKRLSEEARTFSPESESAAVREKRVPGNRQEKREKAGRRPKK